MERCPSCGAHREATDDYCPVCGETLTEVQLSEATGDPWHERPGTLLLLVIVFWPAALYGVCRARQGAHPSTHWVLLGCALMLIVWGGLLF